MRVTKGSPTGVDVLEWPSSAGCSAGATPGHLFSSSCSPPPRSSSCTASSVLISLPAIWRRSSPGCITGACSSLRSLPPATSSAPGARSCSFATGAAGFTRRRGCGPGGFAASGSRSCSSSRCCSPTSSSICGHCRGARRIWSSRTSRRAGDRHGLQRRDVLQAPVPDRAVQLRGVDDLSARTADSRTGRPATRAGRRTASPGAGRPRRRTKSSSGAASCASFCRPRSATSTARSAWTACTHARTTTSASPCGRRESSSPTCGGDRGLAASSSRPDIAVLSVLFVFGALLNAFAMTGPAHQVEQWLAETLGTTSESVVLGCLFVLGLGVAPLVLLGTAAGITRRARPPSAQGFSRCDQRPSLEYRCGTSTASFRWASACGWRITDFIS